MRYDALRDSAKEHRVIHLRIFVALFFVVALIAILVYRYHHLQINQHEIYHTKSQSNRVHLQRVPPSRGLIYDRNGRLLAENQPSFTMALVRDRINDTDAVFAELKRLALIDDDDIERFKKREERYRIFESVPLRFNLTDEQIATVAANRVRLEGVEVNADLVRYYPEGEFFVHMLGYVGRINERELKSLDVENYAGTNHIGKIGVEKFYEDVLHGTTGYENVETNAQGRVLRVLERVDPVPGKNIRLHMDLDLQKVAYKALGSFRGAIVAIDTHTGGVLAAVSTPSYNPNLFVNGISFKDYNALRDDLDLPLYNRVIQAQYPPGSTTKPVISFAGLETESVTINSRVKDPGWFQLPNDKRRYRDWKRQGHGDTVGFHEALEQSCDVYFYDLAFKLGIRNIYEYYDLFGLGKRTGIDVPNERKGINPSPDWKRGQGRGRWFTGDSLNLGIGQGFLLATPMQLAYMTSILANQGERIMPRMVSHVENIPLPKEALPPIEANKSAHWNYVREGLESVIHGRKGTARRLRNNIDYRIAGKSGTAQVVGIAQGERYDAKALQERQRDHALFVAYAPARKPDIAVAVMVENGEGGSSVAGPMAKQVIDAWIKTLAREKQKKAQALEALKAEKEAVTSHQRPIPLETTIQNLQTTEDQDGVNG
ncbi:Peptidoglycan D,D-transpeptidase MrdA [BD1-7 clade bacterium]|uniref:Peptidoglycan D,D-transpeptidase MrdA n=1 Tax=BD1-7 clade bacterium TaxID=2029982 RepID=A0A5S9QYU5_9GAMM|nr:Peptidoglycan D,D-transpeptidase MrdA [BD1-7 clade bacterium]